MAPEPDRSEATESAAASSGLSGPSSDRSDSAEGRGGPEADVIAQVAISARGLAVVMAIGAIALVVPGWALHWSGISSALRLPALASCLLLVLGLLGGFGMWRSVGGTRPSPWQIRTIWFAVSGIPAVLALALQATRPEELAPFLFDIVPILWTASTTLSVLLLSPATSVGIGLWCAAQYAYVYVAAGPQLAQLHGPEDLILELTGLGGAARRTGLLALLGVLTGGASGLLRRTVIERFRHREHAQRSEAQRLSAEAKRLQAELDMHRAAAASQAKTRFIAEMSHELRAPLSGIVGRGGALETAPGLDAEARREVSAVMRSARHLAELVADARDHALVERGQVSMRLHPFDVRDLVEEVADTFRIGVAPHGVPIRIELAAGVPHALMGDVRRIRQVLLNLVSNATRHTTEGHIELGVSGEGLIVFEVRDTGRGMHPDELARVFEAFEQAGPTPARAGGMGLGLAISRTLVEAMGGSIHLESVPGAGTRARISLPLLAAEGQAPASASPGPRSEPPPSVVHFPAPTQLAELRALAELGDLGGLGARLADLRDQPRLGPFVAAVEAHRLRFEHDAILVLLQPRSEP